MSRRQRVGIAEIRIARAPAGLVGYGLGSCLAISLYDPELRLGGFAHALLPRDESGQAGERPGKYVSSAVEALLAALVEAGAAPQRLQAKLAGGATMFPGLSSRQSVGERNVQMARQELSRLGIPLVAEDVGGSHGRTCELLLNDGKLLVRLSRGRDRIRII
ncbi:chemotaxis protein CheD [Geothermobacter ehrlichii]|uniref:Probable chemoreceptor glutamine deamidase CheD n=1 Tax=Geothermobacter ehrlichii TaxID=213224 RepID=A0A5D3WIU1_9BACT|nr:chemotaxis protein CheD [Geothermobacter ehrlichii]TYO98152.1 chemotaxis protein CheD [Geothermobacter ehrlichii]